jgi:hypothetical protein
LWHDRRLLHGPAIADSSQERLRRPEYFAPQVLLSGANDTLALGVRKVLLREATMTRTKQRGPCQVRSKTAHPCPHQAVVEICGVPFCKTCAREQQAYFAMGELTLDPRQPS